MPVDELETSGLSVFIQYPILGTFAVTVALNCLSYSAFLAFLPSVSLSRRIQFPSRSVNDSAFATDNRVRRLGSVIITVVELDIRNDCRLLRKALQEFLRVQ